MAALGDFLPPGLRQQLAADQLRIGSVIRVHVADTHPPKVKRYVVIGFTDDTLVLGSVYINTEINPARFPTPGLRALHLPIAANGRPYLDHDSFIDCSQIRERSVADVKAVLEASASAHIGDLSEGDLADVNRLLKTAPTISVRQKKRFRLTLK